jgi:hypothetical protein
MQDVIARDYYKTINSFCLYYILIKERSFGIILIRIFVADFRK